MLRNVLCIGHQHSLWLVALAAAVCIVATSTALHMLITGASRGGDKANPWVLFAGVVGGCGAWATHFIGMLAFDPGLVTGYDPEGTAFSLFIVIVFGVFSTLAAARLTAPWRMPVWSALFTVGVGAMHYTGMLAFRLPATLSWHPAFVVASLAVGAGLSALSLALLPKGLEDHRRFVLSALCLAAAICGLHFVGMAGIVVSPDPRISVPHDSLPRTDMALLVGGLTLLIALAAIATSWIAAQRRASALTLLKAAFDAVPHGLAYFDPDDRLVFGNETYHREKTAFGLNTQVGLTYTEILQAALHAGTIAEAIGREDAWAAEILAARRNLSSMREQAMSDGRILQVFNNHTADGGLITSSMDITALKQQAEALMLARDQAEAAHEAKSAFLANMSHELRTPMNGVMGVADLLAREALTPHQMELVSIIRSSGASLDRLLADLLDMSKLEAGVLESIEAPFNLAEVATQACSLLASRAEEKQLALRRDIAANADAVFMGDRERIRQILTNLLSNAIKFTSEGEVAVTVRVEDGIGSISVADTGIGFDPARKAKLFARFEQADGSITRRFGGSGLGLAIADELAHRMGGRITADNRASGGSVFTFSWPLSAAEPKPDRVETQPLLAEGDATRALVVDDNSTNQRVLSLMLEGAGMQCRLADNGQAAVDLWRTEPFDVVFMDIQMPVMDGLTAVKAIRALEVEGSRPHTPILMVSANALPEHLAASHDAGADGHLAKPVTADRLFAALERLDDNLAA